MNARLIVRMTAPVVATSLLLLAVGVGAAWYVHRWQKTVARDVRVNVSAMRAAEELEIAVREIRARLDRYLITNNQKQLKLIPPLERDVEHWLVEAERWAFTAQEKALMNRFRGGQERFHEEIKQLTPDNRPADLRLKLRALIDEVLIREMLEPVHEFLDVNEEEVEQAIAQHEAFAERLVYGLLLLGICGSGAGLVAGFGFARGFSHSLIQLSVPIRAVAGQLDAVVGPITFSGGDLPELEGALRLIADRIGSVVERLRQSEREALRAEQLAALGQMAAGMAHELRNPLTSMKMLVQGAQMTDPWTTLDQREGTGLSDRDLQILESEINRLERLIQGFLDYARPPQPEKQRIEVVPQIEQAVRLIAAQTNGRTTIEFTPPRVGVTAMVDPGQFRQVLLNLLRNAIDAVSVSQPGGELKEGLIEVTIELASDGLDVRVSDNGCGLPAHLGLEIFVPFTTTKETGLGLGLSISKRIAEAHGGTLTAANRPGGGAIFTLHLPGSTKDEGQSTKSESR